MGRLFYNKGLADSYFLTEDNASEAILTNINNKFLEVLNKIHICD